MTSRPQSFASRALMTYGSNVGASVLSLGNVLIIARGLDATGRGQIAFLTTVALLTSQLATVGIPQANAYFSGKRPELTRVLATNSVIAGVLTGVLAAGVVALLVAIFPKVGGQDVPGNLRWLALATVPVLILGMSLHGLCVAQYGFRAINAAWLVTPVLTVTANGIMLAVGQLTVGRALGSWIVGQTLATAILGWFLVGHAKGFGRPDAALARRAVRFGVQAHAGRVLNQGNYRADQWIMGALAGSKQLGIYSVAVAWTEALFFLPAALSMAQMPDVTRATPREASRQAAVVFRATTLLTAVLAVGMIILAPFLATTVFGAEFSPATAQIRVLTLGAFGIVALKVLGQTLTLQNRPMLETAAIAVTFLGVIGLDFLLIPDHAGMGAAIASLAGYTAGGVCIAVIFCRALAVRPRDLIPRARELVELARLLRRRAARGVTAS